MSAAVWGWLVSNAANFTPNKGAMEANKCYCVDSDALISAQQSLESLVDNFLVRFVPYNLFSMHYAANYVPGVS